MSRSRKLLASLAACCALAPIAAGFNLSGQRWPNGQVVMQLQLGPANAPLSDGAASWNAVAEDALSIWNSNLTNVRYTVVRDSTAPIVKGRDQNGVAVNNVFWSSTVYGDAWGSETIGITLSTYNATTARYTETDVLFNTNVPWDSYRGPLRRSGGSTVHDFRRVALHEFGHALGLNHPDAVGQRVTAIMNARASDTDTLQPDDIAGGRAIYDNPNNPPATLLRITGSVGFASQGSNVTLTAGRVQNDGDITSGAIRLELWAMPQHYENGLPAGARNMATYPFPNPLAPGAAFTDISVTTAYTRPPNGSYYVVMLLTEFTGSSSNDGYTIRDFLEFSNPLNIGTPTAPTISTQPVNATVVAGSTATFAVVATGGLPLAYQWRKDGVPLNGETKATLSIANVQPSHAGAYSVVITNSLGSVTSNPAALTVNSGTPGPPVTPEITARLSNLSVRTALGAGQSLIVGFAVGGGSRQLLVRGVGPTLSTFGVGGTMADPRVELYNDTTLVTQNDDWGNSAAITNAAASVGAFPLQAGSRDAALLQTVEGARTVQLKGTGAGVVLVELYDTGTGNSPRLINVSARNQVGTGDNILIFGFVVAGTGTKNVLIRAVGPTLAGFGLTGVLADPRFEVFASGSTSAVASNDNWDAALTSTFSAVGAFPLTANSRDAARVVSLAPGAYTVQVSGVNNTTGEALVEIYEAP